MTCNNSKKSWKKILISAIAIALLAAALPAALADGPWSTFRGNPQRTAHTDGKAGPAKPKVLWVLRTADHFVASPVPVGDRLVTNSLGGFNVSTIASLDVDPKAKERVVWSQSAPFLSLPSVSSPAVADGKLIFGDGVHQTNGAMLHCLDDKTGLPLWRLNVPGALVHLEGGPTIQQQRAYVGGGSAGVLCVDINRVKLEGKEYDLPGVKKILDKRWQELQAKYEAEKKTNPDFAVPPTPALLPRPEPLVLWQQGKDAWHVDAPVAIAGDHVLAASAFLDKEGVGERALFCLDAKTGKTVWQTKLEFNPWGGPSVLDNVVVVGGSTIGFYPNELNKGRGDITAFDLKDGKIKWRKPVQGGVVSSVALVKGLAICTATDGKVRAFDLANGERRWIYDAKFPFFAPPAVANGVVYAGDLRGVVHAIDAANGTGRWQFNLATHADVKSPGMIYAGPVVHGGKVFAATCNLEGPFARQPCVLVCIGED